MTINIFFFVQTWKQSTHSNNGLFHLFKFILVWLESMRDQGLWCITIKYFYHCRANFIYRYRQKHFWCLYQMREKSKLLTAIVDDKLMIVRVHKKLLSFNFFSKQIIMSRACEIVVSELHKWAPMKYRSIVKYNNRNQWNRIPKYLLNTHIFISICRINILLGFCWLK